MPTGYTAAVADGITFEQFVWRCARAMGALVMMREEPTDAPIPERFEASDYNAKKLVEAKAEWARLNAMSVADAETCAATTHAEAVASYAKRTQERLELRNKYQAMLASVVQWDAPTPDHAGFKIFMVDQLKQSIDFDCCNRYDDAPVALSGLDWRADEIAKAARHIEYHAKANAEEIERTEGRNEWLRALRESFAKAVA
jgi:hypothetical protein